MDAYGCKWMHVEVCGCVWKDVEGCGCMQRVDIPGWDENSYF